MRSAAPECPGRIFVAFPDGLHLVGCSALPGHDLTHTAYHADRLHCWSTSKSTDPRRD